MPHLSFTSNTPSQVRSEHDLRLLLLTLCMAVLIAQVDTSVVNLAVRPVAEYFQASVSSMQWLLDGYNLTYASLLLSGGLFADLFGRRRVFMCGALVFTGASLLCASASSLPWLLAGRAVAGFGAALLLPASLAILRVAWRDEAKRGRALGIWAGCNGLAFAIGPVLGGSLIEAWGWRSIFLLTVPLGALALLLAAKVMPESTGSHGRRFDAAAQILGMLALGGLTLAVIEAHQHPWAALGVLTASLLAAAGFASVEQRRGDAALIPPGLWRIAPFRGSALATLGMTFGMYGVLFLLPMTWLASHRLSALGAGLALVPMALVFVAVSPCSGALWARFGLRTLVMAGLGLIAAGLLAIGLGSASRSLLPAEIGLVLTGIGMGLATGPLMGGAVNTVSGARSGTAAALINVARMVGATLGVAALGTLYELAGHGHHGLAVALIAGAAVQALVVCIAARWLPSAARPCQPPARSGA